MKTNKILLALAIVGMQSPVLCAAANQPVSRPGIIQKCKADISNFFRGLLVGATPTEIIKISPSNTARADAQEKINFDTVSYFVWEPGTAYDLKIRRNLMLLITAVSLVCTGGTIASNALTKTALGCLASFISGSYAWYLAEEYSATRIGAVGDSKSPLIFDGVQLNYDLRNNYQIKEFRRLSTNEPTFADLRWAQDNIKIVTAHSATIKALLSTF
jgi:hypothetical protein